MKRLAVALAALAFAAQLSTPVAAGAADPYLGRQWGLESIQAPASWQFSRGEGAVIAIVDTGVDLDHPDLAANLVGEGFDFTRSRRGADDPDGHGTLVAGVAAAVGGNGIGISGVAPEAQILPVRVCTGQCNGTVAEGIRYAVRRGADVINLSLGVPISDPHIEDVIRAVSFATRRGSVVVGAAGNSSEPWCFEPASSALCVGAVDRDDLHTVYSNIDVLMSDSYLVAPGGGGDSCDDLILSTRIFGTPTACGEGSGYGYQRGTSLAAPFVSGVAALLAAEGATGSEIRECLLGTADDLGPEGRDPIYGYGRVNALKAVSCVH